MGDKNKYKTHRMGELDAIYFEQLPQRCKELFFEYMYQSAIGKMTSNPGTFVAAKGFYIDKNCQSPIEQILFFAFDIIAFDKESDKEIVPNLFFVPQQKIIANGYKYIADFYFDSDLLKDDGYKALNNLKLVIECDGHEFHEKTKEQVKRNNERDYNLKLAGYDILHYSGSQIFNDPLKCAVEIHDYIQRHVKSWVFEDEGD